MTPIDIPDESEKNLLLSGSPSPPTSTLACRAHFYRHPVMHQGALSISAIRDRSLLQRPHSEGLGDPCRPVPFCWLKGDGDEGHEEIEDLRGSRVGDSGCSGT